MTDDDNDTPLHPITDEAILDAIYELKDVKKHGLRSNLPRLDEAIGGIWRDGVVIQGLPDAGKTVLAKNLAVAFCVAGNRVIDLDLENDERENLINVVLIFRAMMKGKGAPTRGELMERPDVLAEGVNVELLRTYLMPNYWMVKVPERLTPGDLDAWMARVSDGLARGKQVALFLDSLNYLARMYPFRGTSLDSVEKWVAEIANLRRKWQMPVFIVPHRLKHTEGVDEMMEMKGSSAIPHFARTQIKLERVSPAVVKCKILRAQFGSREDILLKLDQTRLLLTEHKEEREW